jgi:hypothetical protein
MQRPCADDVACPLNNGFAHVSTASGAADAACVGFGGSGFGPIRTGTKRMISGQGKAEGDDAAHVKRPPNSFFLYAKHRRALVRDTLQLAAGDAAKVRAELWKMAEQSYHSLGPTVTLPTKKRRVEKCTIQSEEWLETLKTSPAQPMNWRCHSESTISNSTISQILGRQWSYLKATDPEAVAAYEMEQFIVAEHHKVDNPGYKYKPGEKKQKTKKVGRPRSKPTTSPLSTTKRGSNLAASNSADLTLVQLAAFNMQTQFTQNTKQDRFQSWQSNFSMPALATSIPTVENLSRDDLPEFSVPVPVTQLGAKPFRLTETDVVETLATLSNVNSCKQPPLRQLQDQDNDLASLASLYGGNDTEEASENDKAFNDLASQSVYTQSMDSMSSMASFLRTACSATAISDDTELPNQTGSVINIKHKFDSKLQLQIMSTANSFNNNVDNLMPSLL